MSSKKLERLKNVDDKLFNELVNGINLYDCDSDNALCKYTINDGEHEEEIYSSNYSLTGWNKEDIKKICLSAKRQIESSGSREYYAFRNNVEYGIIAVCNDTAVVCDRDVVVVLKYSFYVFKSSENLIINRVKSLKKEISKK
jgi:hypothetical protein